MSFPRMSLHIGDYQKDTGHLRAAEHGAYLLLIMHYWATGSLPGDDKQLAAIARMTDREWLRTKPILQPMFQDGWKHKRIEEELADAHERYNRKVAASKAGNDARWGRKRNPVGSPVGQRMGSQPTTTNPNIDDDEDARAKPLVSAEASELAHEIAKIAGHDPEFVPPSWLGAPYRVQSWINGGWPKDLILVSVREQSARKRDGPPSKIEYFEKGIAAAIARQKTPLPTVNMIEGQTVEVAREKTGNVIAASDKLIERVRDFTRAPAIRGGEGAAVVRLLPEGRRERPGDVHGGGNGDPG